MLRTVVRKRVVARRNPLSAKRTSTLRLDGIKAKFLQGTVFEIRYRKFDDAEFYKHQFSTDDEPLMYLVDIPGFGKGLVIVPNEKPLWE